MGPQTELACSHITQIMYTVLLDHMSIEIVRPYMDTYRGYISPICIYVDNKYFKTREAHESIFLKTGYCIAHSLIIIHCYTFLLWSARTFMFYLLPIVYFIYI